MLLRKWEEARVSSGWANESKDKQFASLGHFCQQFAMYPWSDSSGSFSLVISHMYSPLGNLLTSTIKILQDLILTFLFKTAPFTLSPLLWSSCFLIKIWIKIKKSVWTKNTFYFLVYPYEKLNEGIKTKSYSMDYFYYSFHLMTVYNVPALCSVVDGY